GLHPAGRQSVDANPSEQVRVHALSERLAYLRFHQPSADFAGPATEATRAVNWCAHWWRLGACTRRSARVREDVRADAHTAIPDLRTTLARSQICVPAIREVERESGRALRCGPHGQISRDRS